MILITGCKQSPATHSLKASELHEVGKLELIEYRTEEIFVISPEGKSLKSIQTLAELDSYVTHFFGAGDRVGIYSFDNYSIAYIDLTQLSDKDIQYHSSTRSVHLTLPPIQIEPIGRSGEIRKLHERVTGLHRSITSEERRDMQNQASAQAIQALSPGTAIRKQLVEQAERKARAYFTGLLHARGYEEVIVTFRS